MISIAKRVLISVSDKTGIENFAEQLIGFGFDIVSTGGTAQALKAASLPVTPVEEITHFPEILDGRVKTLHPSIHGGLLGDRRLATHRSAMDKHGIKGFGLVVLNLYPFERTVQQKADFQAAIENIDIGGLAMLRAAAKNHVNVLPVINADQFDEVLISLQTNTLDTLRQPYASRAFDHTAQYDRLIADWLAGGENTTLRYGENPHQTAELRRPTTKHYNCAAHSQQIQGKELSYNNYLDADSAWELCQDLGGTNAVIVKHNNPCGAASGQNLCEAFERAWKCDPKSAFGGVIALSRPLDVKTAKVILKNFVEVVLAPDLQEGTCNSHGSKA